MVFAMTRVGGVRAGSLFFGGGGMQLMHRFFTQIEQFPAVQWCLTASMQFCSSDETVEFEISSS